MRRSGRVFGFAFGGNYAVYPGVAAHSLSRGQCGLVFRDSASWQRGPRPDMGLNGLVPGCRSKVRSGDDPWQRHHGFQRFNRLQRLKIRDMRGLHTPLDSCASSSPVCGLWSGFLLQLSVNDRNCGHLQSRFSGFLLVFCLCSGDGEHALQCGACPAGGIGINTDLVYDLACLQVLQCPGQMRRVDTGHCGTRAGDRVE